MSLDAHERSVRIQRILDLLAPSEHIRACAMLTRDGFLVGVAPAEAVEGAWAGPELLSTGVRVGAGLGLGAVRESYLVGERGTAMVHPIDKEHVLLVIARAETTLGWVRIAATQATQAILGTLVQ